MPLLTAENAAVVAVIVGGVIASYKSASLGSGKGASGALNGTAEAVRDIRKAIGRVEDRQERMEDKQDTHHEKLDAVVQAVDVLKNQLKTCPLNPDYCAPPKPKRRSVKR